MRPKTILERFANDDINALRVALDEDPGLACDFRALYGAAGAGRADVVELLLAAGADPNAINPRQPGDSALYRVALPRISDDEAGRKYEGHLAVIDLLIEAGSVLPRGRTPYQKLSLLSLAAAGGSTALFDALVAHGATPTLHDRAAILDLAAITGAVDLTVEDDQGRTLLHALSGSRVYRSGALKREASSRIGRLLLEAGVEVDRRQLRASGAEGGPTALWWVVSFGGNLELAAQLIEAGASVSGYLGTAAFRGDLEMVELLLSSGADIDERSSKGHSALHDVLLYRRHEMVLPLLERGADPSLCNTKEMTALHIAATVGSSDALLGALIEAGAPVQARDVEGRTALELAQLRGKGEVVRFLKGAASAT